MASFNKESKITCSNIESLLIKGKLEEITNIEQKMIRNHIEVCEKCRNYESVLINISDTMKIDKRSTIKSSPAIKKNILHKMKSIYNNEYKSYKTNWNKLWSVFEYRIPIYQALSIMVVVFLVLFGLNYINVTNIDKSTQRNVLKHSEKLSSSYADTSDSLQRFNDQNIGRNIQEDSLLIRFVVTSM